MSLFDKFTRDTEESGNDFFEDDIRPLPPKPPKEPEPEPDDPGYWDRDESEWEHLKPRKSKLLLIFIAIGLLTAAAVIAFYLRFFSPYIDDAVEYGYIEHVERRGTFFQTYEGVMIPYREIHDTTRVYARDFIFSVPDAHLAKRVKELELEHKPVMVSYRRYHATLPWRGSSKIVITAIDTVDPSNILPPEFRPEYTGKQ